jgi:hypothetical protein
MNFTLAGKNQLLNTLGGLTAALYTTSNFSTGEVTGGAYARKAITYNTATTGTKTASVLPIFDIPAGVTITHAALFSGVTRIAEGPLVAFEAYTAAGKYQLTASDLALTDPV